MPTCWIIAGPNGAGKTTFALEYLPQVAGCRKFINADLIASGLSPLAPEAQLAAASRLYLSEVESAIQRGSDFGLETTLSGRSYLKLISRLRGAGWSVELIYLALPDAGVSASRVAERVMHGGHDIPLRDLQRRFLRSLRHLFGEFALAASRTRCFMNSEETPRLVFAQVGDKVTVHRPDDYERLRHQARP